MSIIELFPEKVCETCKHWDTSKTRQGNKDLHWCPIMTRGQWCTAKCYCQYWERKC